MIFSDPSTVESFTAIVERFGSLGIVGAIVFWMMKRIDAIMKTNQAALEQFQRFEMMSKSLEDRIAATQMEILQNLRQLTEEVRVLRNGRSAP